MSNKQQGQKTGSGRMRWAAGIACLTLGILLALLVWPQNFASANRQSVSAILPRQTSSAILPAGEKNQPRSPASVAAPSRKAAGGEKYLGSMRLDKSGAAEGQQQIRYSENFHKDKKEYPIMPNVTYKPGEGVSIKTNREDETVEVGRHERETGRRYEVEWQRKF